MTLCLSSLATSYYLNKETGNVIEKGQPRRVS
jgi:hypothetical protein